MTEQSGRNFLYPEDNTVPGSYSKHKQLLFQKQFGQEDRSNAIDGDQIILGLLNPEELLKYGIKQFPKDNLEPIEELGKGNFGVVTLYRVKDRTNFPHELVAVKDIDKMESADIRELELIGQCQHPNIVQCFGCYEDNTNLSIIMEYLSGGDLQKYLHNTKENKFTLGQALDMIIQINRGMEYLTMMKIIHRDLATRNCMLNADRTVVKITDFGLGRKLIKEYYRPTKSFPIPLRWVACECLSGDLKFTEKSDVWSFGVLVWEVLARRIPYYDIKSNKEVVSRVLDGKRLAKPDACPPELYDIMISCWLEYPEDRPSFDELRIRLKEVIYELKESTEANACEYSMKKPVVLPSTSKPGEYV